jgi:excisionase family DNA binding protein
VASVASDLLDVEGAAAYLGVPETYVRRIVLEKRVIYYKLGKYLRFKSSDLDALLDAGRVETATPIGNPQQIRNTLVVTKGAGGRRRGCRSSPRAGLIGSTWSPSLLPPV